jgi:dipeptidyl aminopeptidase/acylaminoacyl peptidase
MRLTFVGLIVVVLAVASPAWATFPGRNGLLAFDAYEDVEEESTDSPDVDFFVGIAHIPGGPRHLFARGADPAYSPNGRSVAYGHGGIWLAGPDCRWPSRSSPTPCSRLRRLTRGYDYSPAWSPNGKRIAFSRYDFYRSSSRIYTVRVNGGGERFLVRGASPDWSSKGALAFTGARDELELRVRDRGGRVRTLPVRGNQPSWAPGGNRLAFVGEDDDASGSALYTIHADGTGLQKVWEFKGEYEQYFPAESPTWSPDGRWIAFIESAERVYAIRPSGGKPRLLMGGVVNCRPCSVSYDPNISALAWQPLRHRSPPVTGGAHGRMSRGQR